MKVAILAGGFGTRLSEETSILPKPMVEIGGRPAIWHIMKCYAAHGLKEFVVLGGYKINYIRDYFLGFRETQSDFTVDLQTGDVTILKAPEEDWKVTVLFTGEGSMTGGRLKRAQHLLQDDTFCLTYGDGFSDVDVTALIDSHRRSGAWATVTAVTQPGRYGALGLSKDATQVLAFREKNIRDGGLINGGYFVCEPKVFDLIDGDMTVWEQEPMDRLVEAGKLSSYWHKGYWQSMDTLRDKMVLEQEWATTAPWKTWK